MKAQTKNSEKFPTWRVCVSLCIDGEISTPAPLFRRTRTCSYSLHFTNLRGIHKPNVQLRGGLYKLPFKCYLVKLSTSWDSIILKMCQRGLWMAPNATNFLLFYHFFCFCKIFGSNLVNYLIHNTILTF